jgi:hypothetical protein
MKNKKGASLLGVWIGLVMTIMVGGMFAYFMGVFPATSQEAIQAGTQDTITSVSDALNEGDPATAHIFVYDRANDNTNTQVATTIYCQDQTGTMVVNGATSSASTYYSQAANIGDVFTCWAIATGYQVLAPTTVEITQSTENIKIDAFKVATSAQLDIFSDTYVGGDSSGGKVNVTGVGASGTGTLHKMRIKNNNTNEWLNLGGIYFDASAVTNVSSIDATGGLVLYNFKSGAEASMVTSSLPKTTVSARKSYMDFVFEIDSDSNSAGNQALLIEENDYFETGNVVLTADSDGCTNDYISPYMFQKGYFVKTLGEGIGYGAENDASSGTGIGTDYSGDKFYCKA